MLTHHQIITFVLLAICSSKLEIIGAKAFFYFGPDFMTDDLVIKALKLTNNQINVIDNNTGEHEMPESLDFVTLSPNAESNELRSWNIQLNEVIVTKIASTKEAIELVNRDLYPLVEQSDYIAAKVELTTRYLNALNPVEEHQKPKLEILEQFVSLVDELKVPPTIEYGGGGGERAPEYVILKLILEKNGILELQENIRHMNVEVLQELGVWYRNVWMRFIRM